MDRYCVLTLFCQVLLLLSCFINSCNLKRKPCGDEHSERSLTAPDEHKRLGYRWGFNKKSFFLFNFMLDR